ncbi:hypothetical protein M8494_02730 [Serratia ureilytica]
MFSALLLMASVLAIGLGQIVGAVDGVVLDGFNVFDPPTAGSVCLRRLWIAAALALASLGDGVRLFVASSFLIAEALSFSLPGGGLFDFIFAVAFALSVRSSAFFWAASFICSALSLALSRLASTLDESSQPATNNPIKEANSTLFHTFIVYILAETLLMVIAFSLPILGQILLKLQI